MPHVLHLLRAPVPEHALAAIERQSRDPGTTLTVVLREGTDAPPLPSGVQVRRLADTLTYAELLDLIFSADQVISW
ncbi:MAG: hypothetical protein A3I03_08140 [Candidatus Rokubacteria bacterium RIFCSPLOWO2_02_FULL_68_19]|nr:MAG: hypothetical protein A3I03_08140 [Candidatus Rokubacteria bacterium RIFCSPLOWO2_02_FULL_68_19]OGL20815.1 MAG: hypothetical protein A3G97_14690 [Candidatus Rokubacteria bacterium RIFCSPLOWO2_12_FULL_69_21]